MIKVFSLLSIPRNDPPALLLQIVLATIVREREVVHPPEPRGDVVGDQDVDGVVAPAQQEEGDAHHGAEEGVVVERPAVAV